MLKQVQYDDMLKQLSTFTLRERPADPIAIGFISASLFQEN